MPCYYLKPHFLLNACLVVVAALSVNGAAVYYFYALNGYGIAAALLLTAAFCFVGWKYFRPPADGAPPEPVEPAGRLNYALACAYLAAYALALSALIRHASSGAIISPWPSLPAYFFPLYSAAVLLLFLVLLRRSRFGLPFLSLHYFLSFGVALFVYRLGFGFDPFVHRATESLISLSGAVDPKPLYYLGQYALVVITHKITFLPIDWLDMLLVPVLAALFLPYHTYRLAKKWFQDRRLARVLPLLLLILPYPLFIVTTPQHLAYLFLLLAILIGLRCRSHGEIALVYLLAFAALVSQPIAGLPALLFALGLTVYHADRLKMRKVAYAAVLAAAIAALPLSFYALEKSNLALPDGQGAAAEADAPAIFKLSMPGKENAVLNAVYLYYDNLPLFLAVLALGGALIAYRHRADCGPAWLSAAFALAFFASYFLVRLLPFNYLISYERSAYADRLLVVTALFLAPMYILALYRFLYGWREQNLVRKSAFIAFIAALSAASLYLSYPRFDRYFNSHLYAVSAADIEAVRWIEENAAADYVVLANQQVSAAALREFGFKKYYTDKTGSAVFYYPIPTGGPLYRHYLDMVYNKPDSATMRAAMDLTGAAEAYFVLNKYWWAFPRILAEAKLSASSYQDFANGEVYVFKYSR